MGQQSVGGGDEEVGQHLTQGVLAYDASGLYSGCELYLSVAECLQYSIYLQVLLDTEWVIGLPGHLAYLDINKIKHAICMTEIAHFHKHLLAPHPPIPTTTPYFLIPVPHLLLHPVELPRTEINIQFPIYNPIADRHKV